MDTKVLIKSILHNIGVIFVGFIFAFALSSLDGIVSFKNFSSIISILFGIIMLVIGFCLRVWATYYFYKNNLKVIVLHPQKKLITTGPFRYSRNPLYLGGNFFIFLGASLILGTTMGILITLLHLPLIDLMIQREERQLEKTFGEKWINYSKKVHRWI